MLNIDAVTLRLDKIEQNVSLLKELAALSFSDFQKNPVNFQAAQHLLQVLNIGSHIISAIGARRLKEYKDLGDFNEFSRQISEFIKEYEKTNNVEK